MVEEPVMIILLLAAAIIAGVSTLACWLAGKFMKDQPNECGWYDGWGPW